MCVCVCGEGKRERAGSTRSKCTRVKLAVLTDGAEKSNRSLATDKSVQRDRDRVLCISGGESEIEREREREREYAVCMRERERERVCCVYERERGGREGGGGGRYLARVNAKGFRQRYWVTELKRRICPWRFL